MVFLFKFHKPAFFFSSLSFSFSNHWKSPADFRPQLIFCTSQIPKNTFQKIYYYYYFWNTISLILFNKQSLRVCPSHYLLLSIGSLGKDNSTGMVTKVVLDTAILVETTNGLRIKTWQVMLHFMPIIDRWMEIPCLACLHCKNYFSGGSTGTLIYFHLFIVCILWQ